MPQKHTTETFIARAKEIHGELFDYSSTIYGKNSYDKVAIICRQHGEFYTRPALHLRPRTRNKGGCRECKSVTTSRIKRKSKDDFIKEARAIHGNKYDYSFVKYTETRNKIIIRCPEHGLFEQRAASHLIGQRCAKCAGFGLLTTDDFIRISNEIHKFRYDYSVTNYITTTKQISYLCPIHGLISQIAANHMNGGGCWKCNGVGWGHDEFLRRANEKHSNFYSYPEEYRHCYKKIRVVCPNHGEFLIQASNHLIGQGCRKCSNHISRLERQWLDSLGIPEEKRQIPLTINKSRYICDAIDYETNTVYEFWGDKWHGNPKIFGSTKINSITKTSYGDLFRKTQKKREAILGAGFTLIEIWETDWLASKRKNQ